MGMKVVECIIFIIFSKDNGEILRNPFVDAGFDLREFFGGELMVDIEVEAEALGSEIAAFCSMDGSISCWRAARRRSDRRYDT